MALDEYIRKRDFGKTGEPSGEVKASAGGDLFVIQKHAASRLHYDFRLELDDVLLSWSVPKGPSLDPAQKRLAVQVEDHPLDYAMFEGIIPKGQYGGGTVLLWDRGTWESVGDARAMLRAGNLKFLLRGEKLHGKYALVKIKERRGPRSSDDGRNWLLIKERDAEARPEAELDVTTARAESVATGRSMDEIAADPTHVWHSNRVQVALDGVPGARAAAEPPARPRTGKAVAKAKPPEGPGWLHEMQIEGRRLLARAGLNREVELFDESGKRLPPKAAAAHAAVANAVRLLPAQRLVVDGVATALYPDGRPRARGLVEALAGKVDAGAPALAFYLTDLLFLDGHDLGAVPLAHRKRLLGELLARVRPPGILRLSEHFEGDGAAFYREACRVGLPAIISRRADSPTPPPRGAAVVVKCAAAEPSTKKRVSARARP